ncbi:putative endolysin [Bacillus phage vB_BspM_AgentSmith]|nr:putative endolysin [Bacillus phage vB_BspM_AgentSmith]
MAESIEELNKSVREMGDISKGINKTGMAISIISGLISGMSKVVDKFDVFLKTKGIDFAKGAKDLKKEGGKAWRGLKGKAKDSGLTGQLDKAIVKTADIAGQIKDTYASYDENTVGPPRPGEELKPTLGVIGKSKLIAEDALTKGKDKLKELKEEYLPKDLETKVTEETQVKPRQRLMSKKQERRLRKQTTQVKQDPIVVSEEKPSEVETDYVEFDENFFEQQAEMLRKGFFDFNKDSEGKSKSSTPVVDTVANGLYQLGKITTMGTGQLSMAIASNLEKATWFVTKHSAKLAWGVAKWSGKKILGGLSSLGGMMYRGLDKLTLGLLGKTVNKVKEKGKQAFNYMKEVGGSFMDGYRKTRKNKLSPETPEVKAGFKEASKAWDKGEGFIQTVGNNAKLPEENIEEVKKPKLSLMGKLKDAKSKFITAVKSGSIPKEEISDVSKEEVEPKVVVETAVKKHTIFDNLKNAYNSRVSLLPKPSIVPTPIVEPELIVDPVKTEELVKPIKTLKGKGESRLGLRKYKDVSPLKHRIGKPSLLGNRTSIVDESKPTTFEVDPSKDTEAILEPKAIEKPKFSFKGMMGGIKDTFLEGYDSVESIQKAKEREAKEGPKESLATRLGTKIGDMSVSITNSIDKATLFMTEHAATLAWDVAKWSGQKLLSGIKGLGGMLYSSLDKLSGGRLSKSIDYLKNKGKELLAKGKEKAKLGMSKLGSMVGNLVGTGKEKAAELLSKGKDKAKQGIRYTGEVAGELVGSFKNTYAEGKEGRDEAITKAKQDISNLTDSGKEKGVELLAKGKEKLGTLKTGLGGMLSNAKTSLVDKYNSIDTSTEDWTVSEEERKLLRDVEIQKEKDLVKKRGLKSPNKLSKKGLLGMVGGIGALSLSSMTNKFNSKVPTDPEEEVTDSKENEEGAEKVSLKDRVSGLFGFKNKPETWDEEAEVREQKRKDEIEEEKRANKERAKPKKKSDWLSKILGAVAGVGSFLLGGFKAVMLPIGKALLRGTLGLAKGIGKLVWPAVKWLSKGLGKATWAVAKWSATKLLSGSKFLFKGLGKGLMMGLNKLTGGLASKIVSGVGKSVLSMGSKLGGLLSKGGLLGKAGGLLSKGGSLLRGGLMAAKAIGFKGMAMKAGAFLGKAAIVASGPVGWAIAGAVAVGIAAYAGYKLYKYLKRNDLREDIYGKLTRLRLLLYGINETNKDYFSKMFDLEMELKDYLVERPGSTSGGTVADYALKPLDAEFTTKALKILGIDREDKVMSAKLNVWFAKRFVPGYLSFMKAIKAADSKIYLDDIEGLKQEGLETFLMNYNIPTSIYQIKEIPIKDNETILVTENDIQEQLTDIKNDILNKSKTPKDINNKITAKNKQVKTNKQKDLSTKKTVETTAPPIKPPDISKVKDLDGEAEIENEANAVQTSKDNLSSSANAKLNMAGGDMVRGSPALEGISTKLDPAKILSMDPQVVELFTGMAKEYNMITGKNISVNEAFRSYEDQAALHRKYPNKAAPPGRSLHEFGLAVDINTVDVKALDELGLLRKYGFATSVGGETWHLEPIGVSLNPNLAKTDMAFREQAIKDSPGRGGLGFGFANGKKWSRNIPFQKAIFASNPTTPIKNPVPNTTEAINNAVLATNKGNTPPASTVKPIQVPNRIPTVNDRPPASVQGNNPLSSKDLLMPQARNINTGSPTNTIDSFAADTRYRMDAAAMTDINESSSMDPVAAIHQAASMSEMDPELLMTVAKIESGLDPNAKAKTSSATGLFQFIASTWNEITSKKGEKYGLKTGANIRNPLHNALMGAEYLKGITGGLKQYNGNGLREDIKAYLGHFLGPGGARSILKAYMANPNASMANAVSAKVFNANRSMFTGKTIAQFIASIGEKLDRAKSTPATQYKGGQGSTFVANQEDFTPKDNPGIAESGVGSESPQGQSQSTSAPMPPINQTSAAMSPYGAPTGISDVNMQQSSPSEAMSPVLNTENMENLLGQQVTLLSTMASVLSSIDGKMPNPDGTYSTGKPTTRKIQDIPKGKQPDSVEGRLNDPKQNYESRPMTDQEKQDASDRDKRMYEKRKEMLLKSASPVSGNSVSVARTSMNVDVSNY